MSIYHRVKIDEAPRRCLTEMLIAHANVRTLREKRKRGYDGSLNMRRTRNNWKIPALIKMMKDHGIYLLGLSETRRRSGITHVGGGYLLIISQNERFQFLGGSGFLLSPAAATAFRKAGSKLWYPRSGHSSSGRYLDIQLATGSREPPMTMAVVYAPTMQSEM